MTAADPAELPIEYEPPLVEAAVLAALRDRPAETAFHGERDPLYAIEDPEVREARFRALHAHWFERLGLGAAVTGALGEQPDVTARVGRCVVVRARGAEEGDLLVAGAAGAGGGAERTVLLRLRPPSFADPAGLRARLRRELLHVADLLDPEFGYTPEWLATGGPVPPRLVRERYRIAWDVRVDGRLVRRGWAPAATRAERLRQFAATFPMLGERVEGVFGELFDGTTRRHAGLLALALEPARAGAPALGRTPAAAGAFGLRK